MILIFAFTFQSDECFFVHIKKIRIFVTKILNPGSI